LSASAQPTIVSRRRRLLGVPAVAAHRLALALLRRLPARTATAPPATPAPVRIVLANAYGMGGTVRATFALATVLAEQRPVEIVSLRRHVQQPFFPHPPGVTVTVLDDRVASRRFGERLLRALPSLLVHPEDYAYPGASALTDLRLVRRLRAAAGETVIATRPAYALIAAAAAQGATVIGQEHMHLRAHRPALAADIRRGYHRLDALAVLSEGDREDYAALLDGAHTRVERRASTCSSTRSPGSHPAIPAGSCASTAAATSARRSSARSRRPGWRDESGSWAPPAGWARRSPRRACSR
jgi:hypothetical protein